VNSNIVEALQWVSMVHDMSFVVSPRAFPKEPDALGHLSCANPTSPTEKTYTEDSITSTPDPPGDAERKTLVSGA